MDTLHFFDTRAVRDGALLGSKMHAALQVGATRSEHVEQGQRIRHEVSEARSIQKQTGCSWGEALKIATFEFRRVAR